MTTIYIRTYLDIINEANRRLDESRNVECDIFEFEPGQWYFGYERFEDPDGKNDWRDHDVDCFGPFRTHEDAERALASDHANPGGHTTFTHTDVLKYPRLAQHWAFWIKHYLESPVRESELDERANFRDPDPRTEKAFDVLVKFLGIHDSGVSQLWRKLSTEGTFERQIDPRNPINKFTPEQWQRAQAAMTGYFTLAFADGVLTVSAA